MRHTPFVALLLPAVLVGCSDSAFNTTEADQTMALVVHHKFRNAHLMDAAIQADAAGKFGHGNGLGLVIAVNKQRVLDRYRMPNRYRILVHRAVFLGFG